MNGLSQTGARLYAAMIAAHGRAELLTAYSLTDDATPADIVRAALMWGDIDSETLELT